VIEIMPCPFCGKKIDLSDMDTLYPSGLYWVDDVRGIRHYLSSAQRTEYSHPVWSLNCAEVSGGCGAELCGDTKDEVLEKWNRRQKPKSAFLVD